MTAMSFLDQVLYLVKEKPGITAREMTEFFPNNNHNHISASLSNLYAKGGLRRETAENSNTRTGRGAGGGRTYRYWFEPSAQPQVAPMKRSAPSDPAVSFELAEARKLICELEAWKTDAITRYPDLTVKPVILTARKIVADELKENHDEAGARDVLAGKRDHTSLIRATVTALEWNS